MLRNSFGCIARYGTLMLNDVFSSQLSQPAANTVTLWVPAARVKLLSKKA